MRCGRCDLTLKWGAAACDTVDMPSPLPTIAELAALEAARTQALVRRDLALARELHVAGYELVTPGGTSYDLEAYLAAIEHGEIAYAAWDIEDLRARITADMAIVRYRARLTFRSGSVVACWHTDSYERQGDRWLAAWSQATAIRTAVA